MELMSETEILRQFDLGSIPEADEPISVGQIFKGDSRRLVEIVLRDGATLAKHMADVPITVLCLAGTGRFYAGPELSESLPISAGTLLTLGANIEHEVVGEPAVHILVSKFGEPAKR